MRVDFKSWYLFQVSRDEMAGSIFTASRAGSRRVLSSSGSLRNCVLRDREAFGMFFLGTAAMETCMDSLVQLFLEASVGLPCGWWLCLGAEPAPAGS